MRYLLVFLFCAASVFGITPHAYVCSQLGNSVTIIDVTSDTTETIFGFTNPRVVQMNPEGTYAFVGSDDGTLRIINTATHTLLPTVVSIVHPLALAVAPDASFLYVACGNNTVSVIRTSDYTIQTVITGFDGLQDIKITPDGLFAYATNSGNGTVSIIQTSTNTIVGTITGFKKPIGLTLTVDGDYAYVTETSTNTVYVVDTSTNQIIGVIYGFNLPAYSTISPDKTYLFVSNTGNNTISVIRLSDNYIVNTISIPAPKSIAVTQDGLYLYIGSDYESVFKVDLINYEIVVAIPGFENPSNIALTTNNAPADSVNGCQVVVSPTDIYNLVTWLPAPGTPIQYLVYRDSTLTIHIATLPAATTQYMDSNLVDGQSYSYYILARYANGFSATIGSVEVTPIRLCQNP
jgi:YVTN family beta-propeller protein